MMNPNTRQLALSPFRFSKLASEHPFYLGKGTQNATQLSRCDSIELNCRIDTSRDPFVFSTLRQPRCMEWMALVRSMVTL